jgi:hypothetical protein
MKYLKSYQFFENKNNPQVLDYLEEILETLRLDGFKVDVSINEPSLFLRGLARVVGAGSLPDINIYIVKTNGVRYDEIGPYINHVFGYLIEQNYKIHGFSVSIVHQGVTDNGIPYRYPIDLVFVKEGVVNTNTIPSFTDETFDWFYEYFNTSKMENALVKSVSISFKKN